MCFLSQILPKSLIHGPDIACKLTTLYCHMMHCSMQCWLGANCRCIRFWVMLQGAAAQGAAATHMIHAAAPVSHAQSHDSHI